MICTVLIMFSSPLLTAVLRCGRLPVLEYAGGIVISRQRSEAGLPAAAREEFTRVLASHGIQWDKLCPSDNTHCPI